MAVTRFDMLLRQGLMDANLEQYGRALQGADSPEPEFSSRYLRERMRLLADPQAWERRRLRPALRRRVPWGAAAIIAVLLLVTTAAAVTISLWSSFFGGLDQRQQEIIGDMEIGGEETEKPEPETEAERLLPPPVEHGGVTVTPLRILGTKNQLYLVLEIRAPEGTVFSPEDDCQLIGSLRPSDQWWAEHPGEIAAGSDSFTVLEAGTREPNVLVGVVEETVSYDVGGSTYHLRQLERTTADGAHETVFKSSDNETGTWDIHIPESLNEDQVLELRVEGMSMSDGQKTMTLLSMNVSPLGIWWKYQMEGRDPWPRVRMALRMKDGSEIEAAPGQLTTGDAGVDLTGSVNFEKPVDLSQAEAVLWGDAVIPLEQAPEE